MNASRKSASKAPSGPQLYDVINERGEILMIGVTLSQACQTIDERQAVPDMDPKWQGDMRIRSQRLGVRHV